MSSKPSPGLPAPSTHSEAVAEGLYKVAEAAPADEKPSLTLPNGTKEDSMNVSDSDKAESSTSAAASGPLSSLQGTDCQSDAASATSNATQSENRPTRSRTRANLKANSMDGQQNGEKRHEELDSYQESSSTESQDHSYIDALAFTLARLDEHAYKKALFRDANSMLEKLVFPMSFPWAHNVLPVVRNVPRDIDEMPAIQAIDDAEHEICSLGHSIFDLHQSSMGSEKATVEDEDEIPAVARRADHPGEVELVTCAPSIASSGNGPSPNRPARESKATILLADPLAMPAPSPPVVASSAPEDMKVNIPGELSYRLFEHTQEKKRRRLEAGRARLKTLMISVKVDSTSSRQSLFNRSSEQDNLPLLLPGLLPENFKAVPRGKQASRVPAGRTQLTWIEKNSNRASHRVSFKSYLTKDKIENGLQRRPREVTVGIRVNGKLLSSSQITADQLTKDNLANLGAKRKRSDGKLQPVYSTKIVNEALKEAEAAELNVGKRQCFMDTEEFSKRVLSREVVKEKSMGWNNKVTIKDNSLVHVQPRIDCLPAEDGLIHVMCTSPGELPPANVGRVLYQASWTGKKPVCTVCWRDTSVTDEPLSECSDCGVLVHLMCCQNAPPNEGRRLKCATCLEVEASSGGQKKAAAASPDRSSRRSSRTPTKPTPPISPGQPLSCAFCPHIGGAMSVIRKGGKAFWVHDVCRMWCDPTKRLPPKSENGSSSKSSARSPPIEPEESDVVCALCGTPKFSKEFNGIVKCAATGCSIHFHPMCALYLSKCEEIGNIDAVKSPAAADTKILSKPQATNGETTHTTNGEKTPAMNGEAPRPNSTNTAEDATTSQEDSRLDAIIAEDKRLCKQYSLRFVWCEIPESHYARKPSISSTVLPVCFCGIHNPNRDRSLYGLYPGGLNFVEDDIVKIPPKKAPPRD